MSLSTDNNTRPDFSILIGLVSTRDNKRIFEVLESLLAQRSKAVCEIIIASRLGNSDTVMKIRNDYTQVHLIDASPGTSLPELRTLALDRAAGDYVAVIEDHCIPDNDWLESMATAFSQNSTMTVAVGGCVENGVFDTGFDIANFYCEYGYFINPVAEGDATVLPGMNIAYRRAVLQNMDRKLLVSGFWENTVHPVLLRNGYSFFSTNRIRINHCKKFSFRFFLRQRYLYSRYYAGMRFGDRQVVARLLMAGGTLFLPVLLLLRLYKNILAKQAPGGMVIFSYLVIFAVVWAWGELSGYLFGPGDALAIIE